MMLTGNPKPTWPSSSLSLSRVTVTSHESRSESRFPPSMHISEPSEPYLTRSRRSHTLLGAVGPRPSLTVTVAGDSERPRP